MKRSPFLRLNPLVPLKCGRVYDVSITYSESLSSCMLNLNNAFNNNTSEGKQGGLRTDLPDGVYNAP